jgi:hypothetical protein
MSGYVERAEFDTSRLNRGSVLEQDGSRVGRIAISPFGISSPGEVELSSGPMRQLPGSGHEVGMDVGLGHVRDPEPLLGRRLEIALHVPARIDHDPLPGGLAANEVTRLGEPGIEETAKDQVRPPR